MTLLAQLDEASYQLIRHCLIPNTDERSYDIGHVSARFCLKKGAQEIGLNFRISTQKACQNFDEYHETLLRTVQKAFPRQKCRHHRLSSTRPIHCWNFQLICQNSIS